MYSFCTIEEINSDNVKIVATDLQSIIEYPACNHLPFGGHLDLHKGVYNRIIRDHKSDKTLSFTLTTYSDAPTGSGLGSLSNIVVAIIKVFVEWINLF